MSSALHRPTALTPVSVLTGRPLALAARSAPGRRRVSGSASAAAHLLALLAVVFWGASLPQAPELESFAPLDVVLRIEAGPGGGGGGGGEETREPPSVLKRAGRDAARVAVEARAREATVPAEQPRPQPEEPKRLDEVPAMGVEAPLESLTPDPMDEKGVLASAESLVDSAGPGSGGGAGGGSGGGLGPGEGPGVGPGEGGGFGGGAYRLGSGVEPPVLLRRVQPSYTDEALRRKIEGSVVLEAVVLRDGSVGSARVLTGLEPGLDANALAAARQWRFAPAKHRGEAVDVIVEIVIAFRLF